MTKLPLSIARKLLQLSKGEVLPSSSLSTQWLALLETEEVVKRIRKGRTRATLALTSVEHLNAFLLNRFAIHDLQAYVDAMAGADLSGQKAQEVAGDTKLRTRRTFKGFLIHTLRPVEAGLNGAPFTLLPRDGSFSFIYDFEHFRLPANVLVVGIENPENFRYIEKQGQLFPEDCVFVSRYPYSADLLAWLQSIPNHYLHFGDIDLAGIAIFEQEYKASLHARARFFIPENIDKLLSEKGSRTLYNQQYQRYRNLRSETPELQELIRLIHQLKKGLEQEGIMVG